MFEQLVAECDKLDRDDALLASYRPFCPLLAKITEQFASIEACERPDGADACDDAVGVLRGVFRDFLRLGPLFDRAVERAKLTPACAKTLVAPELQYEVIRGYGRALAYLQRSLRTGSSADSEMAEKILVQAEDKADRLPDAKQLLADFRAGCA